MDAPVLPAPAGPSLLTGGGGCHPNRILTNTHQIARYSKTMNTPHRTAPSRPIPNPTESWTALKGFPIREPDEYDYAPDPNDMTFVEAEVCNRINYCGNEIDTINEVIRTMVFRMLTHWGIFANADTIRIDITVKDCEEAITWIEHPRNPVDFGRLSQHVLGLNAVAASHPDNPNQLRIMRGGDMGREFNLTINQTRED